jgi:hypothetical protein
MPTQRFLSAAFTHALEPLTDRALRNAQFGGDFALCPSLLMQRPRLHSSRFTPVTGLSRSGFGHHAPVNQRPFISNQCSLLL